jgi:hypothetical protein
LVIVLAFAGDSTITRLLPLAMGAGLLLLLPRVVEAVRELLLGAALLVDALPETVVLLVFGLAGAFLVVFST